MITSPDLTNLVLSHHSSYRIWKAGEWRLAFHERRNGQTLAVGSMHFKGKFPSMLEGEMRCAGAGIQWQLQPDGDRLAWIQNGQAVGHMSVSLPGFLKKPAMIVESPSASYNFECPRTVDTEWRTQNVFVKVITTSGWFEICLFSVGRSDGPDTDSKAGCIGFLDRLALKLLLTGSEKEVSLENEVESPGQGYYPPGNAAGFFTGRGTIPPPDAPLEQWLLVGAAAVCHGIYYP